MKKSPSYLEYLFLTLCFLVFLSIAFWAKSQQRLEKEKAATAAAVNPEVKTNYEEEKYHLACPFNERAYLSGEADKIAKVKGESHEKIPPRALIISHHLLAKDLINQALDLTNNNYNNIIIVGPNHFESGPENIQASFYSWKTKFGWLKADKSLITLLAMNNLVEINEENFNTEHSVCSLVSFLKNHFPESRVTPFILKSNTPKEQAQKMGQFLAKNCQNCLLIASIDFSHEVSEWEAEINDQKSIEILEKLDEENLDQITCDSFPSLQVLFSYLKEKSAKSKHLGGSGSARKGKLITNSNSNQISGKYLEQVTSYITMIF